MCSFRFLFVLLSIHILFLKPCLAEKGIDWLAFGDIRGNIETCGCDPRTDLGGIERIASLIARERAKDPHILVLDLGNNFHKNEAIKSKYLAHGLSLIRADASLVNYSELQTDHKLWGKRPFVIGNLDKSHVAFPLTQPYIIHKNTVVMGYHWDEEHKKYLKRWDHQLQQTYHKIIQEYPDHKKVLLFSGPMPDLRKATKSSWFDLIVSSNTKHEDEKPGFEEKENPDSLMRLDQPFIRMVPLGGVGVLRGGKLMQQEAPSVAKLLESSNNSSSPQAFPSLTDNLNTQKIDSFPISSIAVSWLDYTFDEGSPLKDLMREYNTETKEVFEKIAKSRLKDLKNSPFIGAAACKSCHPDAFKKWSESGHAKAYDILTKAGKDKDPECVSCHVLGFSEKGGFISKTKSPQFAHVQCENCHGPRKSHSLNPSVKPPQHEPKKICTSCHHVPHSSNFVYEKYWKKIEHGK
ncbi:MAG: hypothetical protein HRU09_05670 [Oligoflexales bacterium]|nr:hypothetical protein [Oligoflexales bacterium]